MHSIFELRLDTLAIAYEFQDLRHRHLSLKILAQPELAIFNSALLSLFLLLSLNSSALANQ
ncbi:hypothetical protein VB740_02105 [Nostoc sp. UHCC 0251]|nr:hypothetical protein [Nostoc sp. UHCC 0251]